MRERSFSQVILFRSLRVVVNGNSNADRISILPPCVKMTIQVTALIFRVVNTADMEMCLHRETKELMVMETHFPVNTVY